MEKSRIVMIVMLLAVCLMLYCSANEISPGKPLQENAVLAQSSDHHRKEEEARAAACKQYSIEHGHHKSGSAEIGLDCDFQGETKESTSSGSKRSPQSSISGLRKDCHHVERSEFLSENSNFQVRKFDLIQLVFAESSRSCDRCKMS
jgi:hypothetical protein